MKIINLLPKPKQQSLRYEGIFHSLVVVIWITLASFAAVLILQYGAELYLRQKVAALDGQIRNLDLTVSKQDNPALKQQIKGINNLLTDYDHVAAGNPRWSKVLKAFAALPPPDIQITSFVASLSNKSITIGGFSPARDKVIQLYNIIQKDDGEFYNIDYPLENIARPSNVQFHFTFYIRDGLLQ